MNTITTDLARQINEHHAQAVQKADEAVGHAIQAGRLLLRAKEGLRHGQFLAWIAQHLTVSPRQAQRYIAAAQGRPVPIRTNPPNATRMSHLTSTRALGAEGERVSFVPTPWAWQWCAGADGRDAGLMSYVVEPSSEHPGFFFVSHLYDEGNAYDCTRRPVAADFVADNLRLFGLREPDAAIWHTRPSSGVRVALQTINSAETSAAALKRSQKRGHSSRNDPESGPIESPQMRDRFCGAATE